MSSNDDMEARHGRMLAELAEAGMGLARGLCAATQQAPVSNADFALLAEAFHTVSRSIRQTIALELKLKHAPREAAAPKPEPPPAPAPAPAPPPPPPLRPERPEQVYWNEYERADWSEPFDSLLLTGDADAINAAIEASVARIQRGLTKAERLLATTCDPGSGAAQDRPLVGSPPQARARTRSDLLSTSSPLRGASGKASRPPPWRNSG